jgi:hypothetical protein
MSVGYWAACYGPNHDFPTLTLARHRTRWWGVRAGRASLAQLLAGHLPIEATRQWRQGCDQSQVDNASVV